MHCRLRATLAHLRRDHNWGAKTDIYHWPDRLPERVGRPVGRAALKRPVFPPTAKHVPEGTTEYLLWHHKEDEKDLEFTFYDYLEKIGKDEWHYGCTVS